jgi:hypothetical protein
MTDLAEILKDDEAFLSMLKLLGKSNVDEMELNPNIDPKKSMLKNTMSGIGSSITSSAGTGASLGGVPGAAIGGGAMLLKELFTLPGKIDEMNKASKDWSNSIMKRNAGATDNSDLMKKVQSIDNASSAFRNFDPNEKEVSNEEELTLEPWMQESFFEGIKQPEISDVNSGTDDEDGSKNPFKYLPEAAATAQMIGGAIGTISAGKRPDMNISRHLQQIASETAKEAGYGLDPGTKAAIKSSQERSRRTSANDIINRGGSTQDQMQNLIALDANKLESDRQLELEDYREKERKKGTYQNIKLRMADHDMAVQGDKLKSYHETQSAFAEMLGAGIGNIIGAREYKDTLDVFKKTRDTNVFK